MPSLKHTHQYVKFKGRPKWYKCAHPDCSHTAHYDAITGKRSQCACGETFILDAQNLRLAKPHCEVCTKGYVPPKQLNLDLVSQRLGRFMEDMKDAE